jgi:hypothetical protein
MPNQTETILHFLFVAASLKQSKRWKMLGGITITTPSHLKISYQTRRATLQWSNKWTEESRHQIQFPPLACGSTPRSKFLHRKYQIVVW